MDQGEAERGIRMTSNPTPVDESDPDWQGLCAAMQNAVSGTPQPSLIHKGRRPAKGYKREGARTRYCQRIVVGFEPQTFDEIAARAKEHGTSFGQQVRELVEAGLEDALEDAVSKTLDRIEGDRNGDA